MKKSVDFRRFRCYITRALEREWLSQKKSLKKDSEESKKVLDKVGKLCYNNKATHLRGGTRASNRAWKKILANRKKFLTNSSRSAKIAKLLNRKARVSRKELEEIQKNLKKVLDKLKKLCYNNKAAAEKASAESTLKIEQCKNSLC